MIGNIPFSVCMSVYYKDNPKWFCQAVESVLNQTVKPNEIILVVDGPVTDELNQAISKYEEVDLFKIIRLEENMGHGEARRTGLENCKNELVALMDADDISVRDRFEKQLEAFCDESLSIVGGNIAEFVGSENNVVGLRTVYMTDSEIKKDMKKRCPMNQVTVMFKKADIEQAGGYLDWYCEEDYYLWLRMYLKGMKFANLNDVLVNVRVGEDMYKRRGGLKYFKSEFKLQGYMLKNRIIGLGTYLINVAKRLIVQVLLPNRLRGFVFKKFARKQAEQNL